MDSARIMIIGGPGSGKSWLARRLSRLLDIPVYCVDDALHDEGGSLRTNSDIDRTVCSWASGNQWIIEGGNSRTYADRVAKATVLIYMNPPRWLRLCRVAVREKFRFPLLYWSWKYDEVFGAKDRATLAAAENDVVIYTVRTKGDVNSLLDQVSVRAGC